VPEGKICPFWKKYFQGKGRRSRAALEKEEYHSLPSQRFLTPWYRFTIPMNKCRIIPTTGIMASIFPMIPNTCPDLDFPVPNDTTSPTTWSMIRTPSGAQACARIIAPPKIGMAKNSSTIPKNIL
jgi:hypothetical protein